MANNTAATRWLVNVISAVLIVVLATTGLMNWLVLPRGGGAGFLAGTRHFLRDIHEWTAVLFMVAVCFHVALHWGYVKTNLKKTGILK